MPLAKRTDKFKILNPQRSGPWKNRAFLAVNCLYNGGTENISIQDLIDYLKEKDIDPSSVKVDKSFRTYVQL